MKIRIKRTDLEPLAYDPEEDLRKLRLKLDEAVMALEEVLRLVKKTGDHKNFIIPRIAGALKEIRR